MDLSSGLWSKWLDDRFIAFQEGTTDEINTIRHSWKNSIKAFPDGFGFTGQIDNQCLISDTSRLAG